ncbi:MAG: flavodoxin family protein [bacterium]
MKILAINGSPRHSKTEAMIKTLIDKVADDSEIIHLSDLSIRPCTGCRKCATAPFECQQEDGISRLFIKMRLAEIIILASPTYFDNVTGIMKNFFDRCLGLYWSKKLEGKKVILLTIAGGHRSESAERCLDAMEYWSKLMKMQVIEKIGAFNGDEHSKDAELETLSNKLPRMVSQ